MSWFTKICFAAGTSCLGLALALNTPLATQSLKPQASPVYTPPQSAPLSLAALTPKPAKTFSIPAAYRSRVIASRAYSQPTYARPASPLPRWTRMQRSQNSEESLERALRELAQEVAELKRARETKPEAAITPIEEIAEEIPNTFVREDPLAHLPAVRRRPDIDAAGTAFTSFGFRPFKSDWADVVFRQFRTPGLI